MINKLTILTIAIIIIATTACNKETDKEEPIITPNPIKEYIITISNNGSVETKYILNEDHKLKQIKLFPNDWNAATITYHYTTDKKLDYSYNSTTGKDTVWYEYQNNKINKISGGGVNYMVTYTTDGKPKTIQVNTGGCLCEHEIGYTDGNVTDIYYTIPPGYFADTLHYDNYKNPFADFWPFGISDPKYMSANNITYHKNIKVEDTNYGTGQPPSYSVVTTEIQYSYSYNSDSLPYEIDEYNLTTMDTNHYKIDYLVNLVN